MTSRQIQILKQASANATLDEIARTLSEGDVKYFHRAIRDLNGEWAIRYILEAMIALGPQVNPHKILKMLNQH